MKSFGILGCGNLSTAIVERFALTRTDLDYACYTPTLTRAEHLGKKINGTWSNDPNEFLNLDIYLLACKPQQFLELAKKFKNIINKDALIISVMAGVDIDSISKNLNNKNIIRLMPNTASKFQKGMTLFYHHNDVPKKYAQFSFDFAQSFSKVYKTKDQQQLEDLTVFTGSGPGIFLAVIDQITKIMKEYNISEKDAENLLRQTFIGTSSLLENTELSFKDLISEVTSKKGVTLEVIESLNQKKELYKVLEKSYLKGIKRTHELGAEIKMGMG